MSVLRQAASVFSPDLLESALLREAMEVSCDNGDGLGCGVDCVVSSIFKPRY